ncbi:monooxygenase family protein [Kocuria sp. NPDC057446]|uniref:monooxygenase family protein n=1 Tax=Kocuria sp. NPDC057446 TaxID=3346137 RepID=UPI0036B552EF
MTRELYAYASQPHARHRPAWATFNRLARKASATVGIRHETFVVARAESVYVGMPPSGLAEATTTVPVTARSDRAVDRLTDRARRDDTAPEPPAEKRPRIGPSRAPRSPTPDEPMPRPAGAGQLRELPVFVPSPESSRW